MDKDQKNIIIGAVIGGIVGLGASMLIHSRKSSSSPMDSIGKTLSHLGDILESSGCDANSAICKLDKKLHKEESTIHNAIELVSAGINLWNRLKKGA